MSIGTTASIGIRLDYVPEIRPASKKGSISDPTDGDTPTITQPIRLVSVDTAEKKEFAGGPDVAQEKLDRTRQRLQSGFFGNRLPPPFVAYMRDRLGPTAASWHLQAADNASAAFRDALDTRAPRNRQGRRNLAVIPTGEIIDSYGRLLAYVAPWIEDAATLSRSDPRRRTFNLEMVETGQAASFIVFPSLPRRRDLEMFLEAAREAWNRRRGQWDHGREKLLLGYEYRAAIRLADPLAVATRNRAGRKTPERRAFFDAAEVAAAKATLVAQGWRWQETTPDALVDAAFRRDLIDIRTATNLGPYGHAAVPPPDRLWVWTQDRAKATDALGLR